MAQGLLDRLKMLFDGDPGVRRVADDPALSAELLLLFRMILADGEANAAELKAFRRLCADNFGIPAESLDGVIEFLRDFGYETTGSQALSVFRELPLERRRTLVQHMGLLAKADRHLAEREMRLLARALEVLGLQPADAVPAAG
jgi:uncharacterized tellurite resistance protein B-like protein